MQVKTIYADVCGSAQVSPKVIAMMEVFFSKNSCANPNANHALGMQLLEKIERSRADVALSIGAKNENIIFNSGSSEGCANIFYHFFEKNKKNNPLILYSPIEHPCTLENIKKYREEGVSTLAIPHKKSGEIDVTVLQQYLEQHQGRPILACIMAVHNETGIIQPIKMIAMLLKKYSALLYSDMTQAIGKISVNLIDLNIDYAVASGHKFGALPGVGFLYVKDRPSFSSLIPGGGQENSSRGGTQNYLGIFSLAIALQEKRSLLEMKCLQHDEHRNRFEEKITNLLSDVHIVGKDNDRIPLVSFFAFKNTNSKKLQLSLNKQGIYTSTGSACSDKKTKLSATVQALGLDVELASNTLRISIEDCRADEVYERIYMSIEQAVTN